MYLYELLNCLKIKGNYKNHFINDISINHNCNNNDIFICIKGNNNDGHDFVNTAIKNGAKTIFSTKSLKVNVNLIVVDDTKVILAKILKIYYHNPSSMLNIIGVTGTNGKTTITNIAYDFFKSININTIYIGTNGIYKNNEIIKTNNTTPDIVTIYKLLNYALINNIKYIIMEVSSIAVSELRVFGIEFKYAIYTNLTLDHLDYHKTMDDYKYNKALLLWKAKKVIINKDDSCFSFFNKRIENSITYSIINDSNYKAINIINEFYHQSFIVNGNYIQTNLIGLFNIYNLLSIIALIDDLKIDISLFINFINNYEYKIGRMQRITNNIIVDYAHTPDGIYKAINAIKEVTSKNIITVFGCGGMRDVKKRNIMGSIALNNSYHVIFTNDNPRCEDELMIIADIIDNQSLTNYEIIPNRKLAIKKGMSYEGILLVLGKGNEEYQIIGNNKIHYSDINTINELLKGDKK